MCFEEPSVNVFFFLIFFKERYLFKGDDSFKHLTFLNDWGLCVCAKINNALLSCLRVYDSFHILDFSRSLKSGYDNNLYLLVFQVITTSCEDIGECFV